MCANAPELIFFSIFLFCFLKKPKYWHQKEGVLLEKLSFQVKFTRIFAFGKNGVQFFQRSIFA